MGVRIGTGPVFAFEWLTASRRWQVYALRSLFVGALLAALVLVWWNQAAGQTFNTSRAQAQVGESFFYAIVGTQLALVLLAAPAATAGAICLDKARGNLAHLLITNLTDAEIVLGKLAARLVPVLGFVFCALPVMALGTLLGGIDPLALLGALLLTLGVGIFGSVLAFTLSVWGSKAHEVLLGTYTVLILWMLAWPIYEGLSWTFWGTSGPGWLEHLDPFSLAFAPYSRRGQLWLPTQVIYASVLLIISAALAALSVWRVRPVALSQMGRPPKERRVRKTLRAALLPGPSLDPNPVLWREWHRQRPSRWTRVVWGLYIGLSSLFGAIAVVQVLRVAPRGGMGEFGALVSAFQVSVGLLLLSVSAPTSLAEERVRGSLDVLMSTPLPTRAILWGKWWGTYRSVPWLAVWPGLIALAYAWAGRSSRLWEYPILWTVPLVLVALILAYGAALTSLGLALATWTPRLGRALALTVAIYVLVTIGWVFLILLVTNGANWVMGLVIPSPFYGAGLLTAALELNGGPDEFRWMPYWAVLWTLVYLMAALGLYAATRATFDRCLGRCPEADNIRRPPAAPGEKKKMLAEPALLD